MDDFSDTDNIFTALPSMTVPSTASHRAPPEPKNSGKNIQFLKRGEVVCLSNVPPSRTLLELLREDLDCTGTKEGCGEGDCGACTVVLGEAVDGELSLKAVNSCIRLAHSIDGMALWTVEDIASDTATCKPHTLQAGAAGLALPDRRRSGPLGGQGAIRSERPWGLMIYGIGTDICDIRRIRASLDRHGERFAQKILTSGELETWKERSARWPDRGVSYLATRFSAKEAFSKAIGLGMRMPMTWRNCEISKVASGKPEIVLHGALKDWFEARQLSAHVTVTDESEYAASFVVVEKIG